MVPCPAPTADSVLRLWCTESAQAVWWIDFGKHARAQTFHHYSSN